MKNNEDGINHELAKKQAEINESVERQRSNRENLNDLINRVNTLNEQTTGGYDKIENLDSIEYQKWLELNDQINNIFKERDAYKNNKKLPPLTDVELYVSCSAGVLASLVDIFLVGVPKTSGNKSFDDFDGSVLTKFIRELGRSKFKPLADFLEKKCKVPYDISYSLDGMNANNHRLRGLSHDPFIGLFFAVLDIVLGTTIYINKKGKINIIHNTNSKIEGTQKYLAVLYYIGHIISDMFTARGIPVPGFFMTQFFVNGEYDNSLASKAEKMYLDGYDLRHLGSMSVPKFIKTMIIELYLFFITDEVSVITSVAERERAVIDKNLKKTKMYFIATSITTGGNLIKFANPKNDFNPAAFNMVILFDMIGTSISMIDAKTRDNDVEQALDNRETIENNWQNLLKEF